MQRCLSSLQPDVDVVPDTSKVRRSSDGSVISNKHAAVERTVSVSGPQATESTANVGLNVLESVRAQQNDAAGFDIRDYLIDRCVSNADEKADLIEDGCDGVDSDKTDKDSSSVVLPDSGERSTMFPSLNVTSHRFSDSELMRRSSFPPVCTTAFSSGAISALSGRETSVSRRASSTLPGGSGTVSRGAESARVKQHRFKLLRKALNLFSLDDSAAATATETATSASAAADNDDSASGDSGSYHDDGVRAGPRTEEEQPQRRIDVMRSVSVESLPG